MDKIALPALISRLVQEAIEVGRAEVKVVKTRLAARLRAAKIGLILLVAASLFAFLGLFGLIVGLVLSLAQLVGGAFAGLIVLAVTLLIASILAFVGIRLLSGRTVETKS